MRLTRTRGIVCVVTDRRRLVQDGSGEEQRVALVEQAGAAAAARADILQIRERDLSAGALCSLVRDIVRRVAGTGLRIVVNDRLDVAVAAGADGVHLPGHGVRPSRVRSAGFDGLLITQSIHVGEQADDAADVALFGTVFGTSSKPAGHQPAGVEALAGASRRSRVPVLAIGGITETTVGRVAAVASGVAAIGWFATRDARRMSERVRFVREAFDTIRPVI